MLGRAVVIWLVMLVVASLNGALREAVLIPMMGAIVGRVISSLLLSVLILLLTYLSIRWIGPRSTRDAWVIGGLWVTLTLGFEFIAGHYLFGTPWSQLFEDYNVMRGRIWILVLITTGIAPRMFAGRVLRWNDTPVNPSL
jgi:hypothetical protein